MLLEILRAGPLRVGRHPDPARNTIAAHAQNANVSLKTLTRAKETLQITAFKKGNHWYWQLPTTIPQSGSGVSPLSDDNQSGSGVSPLSDAPDSALASDPSLPSDTQSETPAPETCPSSPANPNATQQPPLIPLPTPPSANHDLLAPAGAQPMNAD